MVPTWVLEIMLAEAKRREQQRRWLALALMIAGVLIVLPCFR